MRPSPAHSKNATPQPAWGAALTPADRRWLRTVWILPVLLACYAAWPALENERMGDDDLLIFHNAKAKDLGLFFENLTADYFHTELPVEIGYYRPLPKVGYLLQFAAFGFEVDGYHAVSIAWLLLATLAAYALLVQLALHPGFAALGAAFFGTHCAIGMPVGLITAQSDIMLATFFFATLFAYLRWVEQRSARWGVLALVSYFLALASKEPGVMIWGVVLLWELGRARLDPRHLPFGRLGLFALPLAVYALIRVLLGILPQQSSFSGTAGDALISAGVVLLHCTVKALLSVWAPVLATTRPTADAATVLLWTLPLVAAAAAIALTTWRFRRAQWPTLLLLLPLVPALSPSVRIHSDEWIISSERWVIVPALGASLFFVGLAWMLLRRYWPTRGGILAFCVLWLVVGVQAYRTRAEVASHKTETDRLIYDSAKDAGRTTTPEEKNRARVAKLFSDRRDRPQAIETWQALEEFYQAAVNKSPVDYSARYMLGEALFHQGKRMEALYHLLISYYGEDPRTGQRLPGNDSLARQQAERAFLIGRIYEQLGDVDEARFHYLETLKHEAVHAEAARRLEALEK